MTVAKLIELLAAVPQDAEVLMHSEDDRQFSTPTAVTMFPICPSCSARHRGPTPNCPFPNTERDDDDTTG